MPFEQGLGLGMRGWWAGGVWLAALALATLGGCAKAEHALTYRLTVTVSDNGRPVSGSVVRREDWVPNQVGGANVPLNHNAHGDAIVLPVRGRLLVVTLAGWDKLRCTGPRDPQGCRKEDDWSPQAAAPATVGEPGIWPWKSPPDASGRASLAADQLPVLVTFEGAPSLAGVQVVDAAHLDEAFGPGVALQSAVVERTNDGVTRGVADALPFLRSGGSGMQECILELPPPPNLPPGAQVKNPDLGDCVWNSLFTE
jgi:hypothetical protein